MQNDATTGKDSVGKIIRRNLSFKRVGILWRRGVDAVKSRGWQALWREVSFRLRLAAGLDTWRYRADFPLRRELKHQRQNPPQPSPLVSVVVPLYNTPAVFLRQLVASVQRQSYANWQLVLADGSDRTTDDVARLCKGYAQKDDRITYLPLSKNEGIAGNTNAGLDAAKGEWLVLLDHDDVLQANALYEVVSAANATGAQLIYSDEAVLTDDLKHLMEYHFKGDYAPDTLRGCNVITHLCAFTGTLLQKAGGGEKSEYDGAQDYDLVLRLAEQAAVVHHIPKVLYFWRGHAGSTAGDIGQKPRAIAAGAAALQAHLGRVGLAGQAEPIDGNAGAYRVCYPVQGQPMVSVLIPCSDHVDDTSRCVASLYQKAGWPNLEVLILDNNSKDPATQSYYDDARKNYPGLRVLHWPGAFNFSAINNFGAAQAKGEHLLLLNNDIELLTDGFITELLSYSQRPDVGAVGAKLYYPDDEIQHGGLIVGVGGTAGCSHKGHPRKDAGYMFRLCTTQNVSAVTGAALMVKRALYEALGGLNETDFAVAFNDVDFCLRLWEKGLLNVFTPFAEAYHFESKSRGLDTEDANKERFEREAAAFRARWAALLQQGDPYYNPHFTLEYENFAFA